MSTTFASRTLKATSTWERDTAPETKTKTRRFKKESRLDGQHWDMLDETSTTSHAYIQQWHEHSLAKKRTSSMLNITCLDRNTKIWVREKTNVTAAIEQVRKRKNTWAGHASRIRDNRWTLRITTWKTGESVERRMERRTRRLLEGYYLAEDSAI